MDPRDLQIGFPPVYEGRVYAHLANTPLWGNEYNFCTTDRDCAVNAGASRCMGVFDMRCTPGSTCICTNAVNSSRLAVNKMHAAKRSHNMFMLPMPLPGRK